MAMRSRTFIVPLLLLAVSASAQTFVFHMRGDQEVPPNGSLASGGCMGTLNQGAATFAITCVHNVADATIMHIHRGAPGVNGAIAFDLGNPASPVSATWTGMTATDISDLLGGNLYVNIHTAGRPNGEIRGQILSRTIDVVNFTATGSQVVPPNGATETATCSADLSNDAATLALSCTHNVASPQSAHVHEAPAGTNGPIVFTFPSAASPMNASMPMTARLVADFEATFLYLDIHGPAAVEPNPTIEIRGQIGTPPVAPTTGTIRIHKATNPSGGTNFGFTSPIAPATFALNDGQTQIFSNVPVGTYTFGENDPSTTPGSYTLADVSCSDPGSSGDPFARTATVQLQGGATVDCTFRNVLTAPTDQIFVFDLSGSQEVPPVATPHRGGCMGRFDAGSSRLTIVCTHNVPDATVMHIHRGAVGASGAIAFDLGSPVSPVIATWNAMTPADVADLLAGNLYVNVHTTGRPNGEIRGQILTRTVDVVNFPMNAAQVVPPENTSTTGNCTADLDTNATALNIQCTHNMAAPDAAHVHRGDFGENGPLVYTFPSAASPFNSNVPMTPRLVADFAGRFLYVDVHKSGGEGIADEIRGQIGAPPAVATTGTIRIVKQSTPSGATGFAFTDNVPGSTGSFTLNDGATKEFASVAPGTYTITESIPNGYSLTGVVCTDGDSIGNPFARTATVSLAAGEVVTCTFRNLRTYTAPSRFVFHLSGDQEVPPVPGSARGGCYAQFNAATSEMSIVCTHNLSDATIMHIHRGARGVNGPVVLDLGNPTSPVNAVWSNMTPSDIADLNAGNLYVNIHTAGRPGGALRGQILPRTVDAFAFDMNGTQEVPPTDSTHTGRCSADLADDASSVFVTCQHNVVNPSATHLHDAPPGEDGPAVFDFPNTSPFSGNAPLTPRLVADFAAGFLYVNVHSVPNYDTGEIRGQLIAGAAAATTADVPTVVAWAAMIMAFALLTIAWWKLR